MVRDAPLRRCHLSRDLVGEEEAGIGGWEELHASRHRMIVHVAVVVRPQV